MIFRELLLNLLYGTILYGTIFRPLKIIQEDIWSWVGLPKGIIDFLYIFIYELPPHRQCRLKIDWHISQILELMSQINCRLRTKICLSWKRSLHAPENIIFPPLNRSKILYPQFVVFIIHRNRKTIFCAKADPAWTIALVANAECKELF